MRTKTHIKYQKDIFYLNILKTLQSNWTNELDALYLVRFYGVFNPLVWKILFEGYKQSLKNYFNALQYRLEFKTAGVYWLWYHQNKSGSEFLELVVKPKYSGKRLN
jgi:hypothetical protein